MAKREQNTANTPTSNKQQSMRKREAARLFTMACENHRRDRLDEAVRGYSRALTLNPAAPDVYSNLGVALRAQGKHAAAIVCYRRSLALKPGNAAVYSNMGNAFRDLGKLDQAATAHQQALKHAPNSVPALYNMGLALRDLGRIDVALGFFDKVIKVQPNHGACRWDRALALLLRGDYAQGFSELEWRWKLPSITAPTFKQKQWAGESLKGKVLFVAQEPGFGEAIQMARYLPLLAAQGATVIVECAPELGRLFSAMPAVEEVHIEGAGAPDFDVWVPAGSLPRLFGTTVETVPYKGPYVSAPELHGIHLPSPLDDAFKVGVVWSGSSAHTSNDDRSVVLEDVLGLLGVPGVTFYSLQKGDEANHARDIACDPILADMGNLLDDFADTAAAISQLDLVITVDTATAHLAGAMGKPVWILLPKACGWRWMQDRADSPWYPTARLFRQTKQGDWSGVLAMVRASLAELLKRHNQGNG